MKRMLMISYYAPPLLNAESILVAKTLKFLSQHYQIDLVTVGNDRDFKNDPFLLEEMGDRVKVINIPNPKPKNRVLRKIYRVMMGRLFAFDNPLWLVRVQKELVRLRGNYDVIYSRSMPGTSHLAATFAKHRFQNVPWIAQFSDPWAHNPYHVYQGKRKQTIEGYERQVIEGADHIIFPTVEMRDLYKSVYPDAKLEQRATVLPHHYDEALYEATESEEEAKRAEGTIRMSYIGDFYGLRSPEPLLKGLTALKERRPDLAGRLELQVVGNIERTFVPMLEAAERDLGLRVDRVGQVPFRESLGLMRKSDILLLVDAPSDVNLFLSSKLIDYLGASRPILGITSTKGTAGRLLGEYGWQVHHPDDVAGIAQALEDYLSRLGEYQEQAQQMDTDRYRSESVVKELSTIIDRAYGLKKYAESQNYQKA